MDRAFKIASLVALSRFPEKAVVVKFSFSMVLS